MGSALRKRTVALTIGMAVTVGAMGQSASPDTTKNFVEKTLGLVDKVLDLVTVERDRWSLAVYPAASYGDRTGLAVGLMPMVQLHNTRLPRPTTITPSFLVSTKKMFEAQCDVDIYLPHSTDINAKAETYRLPDEFYALGTGRKKPVADYDFLRRMLTADVSKGIGDGAWRLGVTLDADYYRFSNISAKGSPTATAEQMPELKPLYTDDGGSYGMGIIVGYDSRDDALQPHDGWYIRLRGTGYGAVLGAKKSFGLVTLDARRYFNLPLRSALAAQVTLSHSWGDVPFVKRPTFGGTRLGRAIGHNLKYVGTDAWLAQCEWRVPLFWRIGATVFGAAGNATDATSEMMRDVHIMAGGGLRFSVFSSGGLSLRLDAGAGSHGDHAVYFNIREAF